MKLKTGRLLSYGDLSTYRTEIMGIAICGILMCHLQENQKLHGESVTMLAKIFVRGCAFVDVFLFLSGIGLYFSYTRNRSLSIFYRKRFMRLMPSYFLIALPYWIWRDVMISGLGWGAVLADISFFSFVASGVKQFWFVFEIIVLYAFFPAMYGFIHKENLSAIRTLIAIAISFIVGGVLMLVAPEIYMNLKIAIDRVPIFLLGIFVGDKVKRDETVYMKRVATLTVACLFLLALSSLSRFSNFYAPFIYVIYSVLGLTLLPYFIIVLKMWRGQHVRRFFLMMGNITLETYLFHSLWKNVFDYPSTMGTYFFAAVFLPIVCGYVVHKGIAAAMSIGGRNARV